MKLELNYPVGFGVQSKVTRPHSRTDGRFGCSVKRQWRGEGEGWVERAILYLDAPHALMCRRY
jgi:hypothetical protein